MSDIAVNVAGLAKSYRIGGPQKTYDRLSDRLFDGVTAPMRRAGKLLRGQSSSAAELDEEIWALKDVSFEIRQGDVVGVIGRNGAGKTTLLKILSRITEPTEGYADMFGRVGSLLEVGTGFHPELTGRENVFLNGAILGMSKTEIVGRFDQMVDFAGIEKFIDTPVKHYSSGMYVRLAFSVAAHLDPDILLIDEVLAVGDIAFQRKCLDRLNKVANEGRTVLFVSHNMGLVASICNRGIYLDAGSIVVDASVQSAVDSYLSSLSSPAVGDLATRTDREGQGRVRLKDLAISIRDKSSAGILRAGAPARFMLYLDRPMAGLNCTISIYDHMGAPVAILRSKFRSPDDDVSSADYSNGSALVCDVDELLLLPGRYRMDVAIIGDNRMQDFVKAASMFDVVEGSVRGRLMAPDKRFRVQFPHRWTIPGG